MRQRLNRLYLHCTRVMVGTILHCEADPRLHSETLEVWFPIPLVQFRGGWG